MTGWRGNFFLLPNLNLKRKMYGELNLFISSTGDLRLKYNFKLNFLPKYNLGRRGKITTIKEA